MNKAFCRPLTAALARAAYTRPCPELPDEDWLPLGVQRALKGFENERARFQEHGLRLANTAKLDNDFASLKSGPWRPGARSESHAPDRGPPAA